MRADVKGCVRFMVGPPGADRRSSSAMVMGSSGAGAAALRAWCRRGWRGDGDPGLDREARGAAGRLAGEEHRPVRRGPLEGVGRGEGVPPRVDLEVGAGLDGRLNLPALAQDL